MKKICLLVPALMQDNNREVNMSSLSWALEHYAVDLIVVNDQEFKEEDYIESDKILYIGKHKEAQGFVKGRNQLLEWFYNSDFDWAVWLDANAKVSKTTLNDFRTLVDAAQKDLIPSKVDVILSTLGIWVSSLRMAAKQMADHKEVVRIADTALNEALWFHGLFMRNFRKVYNVRPMIDERCDPRKGITEDVYFVRLMKKLFNVKLCPTIVINKPDSKSSTWAASKDGKYDYPELGHDEVYRMVAQFEDIKPIFEGQDGETHTFKRVEYAIEEVTEYKSRGKAAKKPKGSLL